MQLSLVLMVFCLSGCRPFSEIFTGGRAERAESVAIEGEKPTAIVRQIISPYAQINSLAANVSLKAEDETKDFTLRCRAQLLLKRPNLLRLSATKALTTEILDFSMIGTAIDAWLPRDRILYRGRLHDLAGPDSPDFHPREIIEQVLLSTESFLSKQWKLTEEAEGRAVLEETGTEGFRNRLVFYPERGELLQRVILTPNGKVWMEANFSRHELTDTLAETMAFPRRIEMRFPMERRRLLLVLRNVEFNIDLSPRDFWIPVPAEDIRIRAIGSGAGGVSLGEEIRQSSRDEEEAAQ